MQRFCERCGSSFNTSRYWVNRGWGRFCSPKCRRGLNPIEVHGDTAHVHLTDRYDNVRAVVLIDAEDVPKLKEFGKRWAASWDGKTRQYRAVARVQTEPSADGKKKRKKVSLYRWLLGAPDGWEVDHINNDVLDNRKSNLRLVNQSQNMQNRRGANRQSGTGVRNVYLNKQTGRYFVGLRVEGKVHYFGTYDDLDEAEKVAIAARRKHMPFSTT